MSGLPNGIVRVYNPEEVAQMCTEFPHRSEVSTGGGSGVPTTRTISTTAPLTGGGDLSADRTLGINDFVASGASHARGAVPDPGASAGTTKFLREDATWAVPAGGGLTQAQVLARTR